MTIERSFARFFGLKRSTPAKAPRRRGPSLGLESLEDRCTPASFIVTTTEDGAGTVTQTSPGLFTATTLRSAFDFLRSMNESHDISFAPGISGGTITFTADDSFLPTDLGHTALVVTQEVAVTGPDKGITLNGNGARRIFGVTQSSTLILEGIRLTGGNAVGGAGGANSFIGAGGGGGGLGGAIYIDRGHVSLVDCTLTENTARGGVGGSVNFESNAHAGGGGGSAAFDGGQAVRDDASNSVVAGGGGGAGMYGVGGNGNGASGGLGGLNQNGQQSSGNGSAGGGGNGGAFTSAVLFATAHSGGTGTATNSFGFGGGGGGGAHGLDDSFGDAHGGAGGFAAGGGGGGQKGDYTAGGMGGFAGGGGGGNPGGVGGFGGGMGAAGGGAGAGLGGAIFVNGGVLQIRNCTITNNTATGGVGGFGGGGGDPDGQDGAGYGGAIFALNAHFQTDSSTISGNNTSTMGGKEIYVMAMGQGATGSAYFANTIIGQSGPPSALPDIIFEGIDGASTPAVAGLRNLISSPGDFPALGLIAATDPMLFPLADNGGRTQTMMPMPGSPVINAGSNPLNLANDQRGPGFARVCGGIADIGAFETGNPIPRVGSNQIAVGLDAGGAPTATVFDANGNTLYSVAAFESTFSGGVRTTVADVNNDGVADLIVGNGPGRAPEVKVFNGRTQELLFTIAVFESQFTGGVFVTASDLNNDGFADIVVTPDQGGGSRVRIIDGQTQGTIADFLGIQDTNFRGGARAAFADINGDGTPDLLVAAGFGGGPRVALFDGVTLLDPVATGQVPPKVTGDFFVFEQTLRDGVFIAGGDINGDGFADVIAGGGPGGAPRVLALSGQDIINATQTQVANFFAGDPNDRGGVRVTAKLINEDRLVDIVAGSGANSGTQVRTFLGSIAPINEPSVDTQFTAFPGQSMGVFVG